MLKKREKRNKKEIQKKTRRKGDIKKKRLKKDRDKQKKTISGERNIKQREKDRKCICIYVCVCVCEREREREETCFHDDANSELSHNYFVLLKILGMDKT